MQLSSGTYWNKKERIIVIIILSNSNCIKRYSKTSVNAQNTSYGGHRCNNLLHDEAIWLGGTIYVRTCRFLFFSHGSQT